MRILVIGRNSGAYRTQKLFDLLFKYGHDNRWVVSYTSPGYFCISRVPQVVRILLERIIRTVCLPSLIVKAFFADVIYVTAMNQREVKFASWIKWNPKTWLIVDTYISPILSCLETGGNHVLYGDLKEAKKIELSVFANATIIIHPTLAELEQASLNLHIKLPIEKVRIVPLAVEDRGLLPRRASSGKLHLKWWGLFSPLHGVHRILEALSLLHSEGHWQDRFHLSIFGIPRNREWIEKATIDFGLENTVVFFDDKSFSDGSLLEALSGSTDVILGSFGTSIKADSVITNKLVEGMSFGIPVFTADSKGRKEFIEDDEAIFTKNEPDEIVRKLQWMWHERECLKKVGDKGRLRYESTFSIGSYQKAITQILAEATRRSSA